MDQETLSAYFQLLHHMAVNDQNPSDPDDFKDAILETAVEIDEHLTDEEIEFAYEEMLKTQEAYDAYWNKYVEAIRAEPKR